MESIRYTKAAVAMDDGGTWLKLLVFPADAQKARKSVLKMRECVYLADLKEWREKRSLDANGYFWKLLDGLSHALGEPKEELYLQYVKECGPFKDFTLTEEEAGTFRTAWSMLGTGWPTEQVDYAEDGDRVVIRAYYGSSTYNTKQMSRLIDSVVADCKAVGVETLPPEKLALMKEEWKR